jgi:hypothetical protein
MNVKQRETASTRWFSVGVVDVVFWLVVAVAVLAGAFLFRHDFSPCNPEYESCATD